MHSSCNCPDHALVCKHIAGLVYMIALEIDKNPELDELCKLHLMQAFRIKHTESYLRWLNILQ